MRVVIDAAFEGYPEGGDKPSRHFKPGEEVEVSDEFGTNVVEKKLAHAVGAAPPQSVHVEEQVTHEAE